MDGGVSLFCSSWLFEVVFLLLQVDEVETRIRGWPLSGHDGRQTYTSPHTPWIHQTPGIGTSSSPKATGCKEVLSLITLFNIDKVQFSSFVPMSIYCWYFKMCIGMFCLCNVGLFMCSLLIVTDGGPGWRTVPGIWSVHGTVPGRWASQLFVPATWQRLCLPPQGTAAVGAWGRLGHRRECWPHLLSCWDCYSKPAIVCWHWTMAQQVTYPVQHWINKPLETFGGYQWGTELKT